MADNVGYTPGTGATVAADEIGGVLHQRVKISVGADGSAADLSSANPMPITAPSAIPVSGPLTDTQLRATAVPVSGPLTDTQLRATAVPVSGPLTDTQLRATAVPVSGPLTDTQLRATAVPVSGPLTDTQLRASPVPSGVPQASSVVIMSLTTAATGSNYTAFSSQTCNSLDIVNSSSVAIEYRRGATGNAMTILSGSSRLVAGITNANQIDVRRTDLSNTQITIPAEAITV